MSTLPRVIWQSHDGQRRAVLAEHEDEVRALVFVERYVGYDAMGGRHWETNSGPEEAVFGLLESRYVAEMVGVDLAAETENLRAAPRYRFDGVPS